MDDATRCNRVTLVQWIVSWLRGLVVIALLWGVLAASPSRYRIEETAKVLVTTGELKIEKLVAGAGAEMSIDERLRATIGFIDPGYSQYRVPVYVGLVVMYFGLQLMSGWMRRNRVLVR
jgi:hypothetical protein